MAKWRLSLILVGILILAFGLRLIALSSRTLWYDEAFAVLFSRAGLSRMIYGTLTPINGAAADVHPLLYYSLLNVWMSILGENVIAIRLFSIVIGMLTIPLVFGLTRDLFDLRTGLVAALVVAIMPFHVQYSQEVRMYALLGLLLIAVTWCFVRGSRTGHAGYWIAFGVLAALSMYTQQLAAFYLLAIGLIPFVRRDRANIIRMILGALLALILYAPWLLSLPSQLSKIGSYWIPKPTLVDLLKTLWVFLFVELEIKNSLFVAISFLTLGIATVFLIWFALRTLARADRDRESLGLVMWLAFLPMILMWLFSQWRPVYLDRGLLPSGLIFFIALAWLLTRTRLPRIMQAIILIPIVLTAGCGLYEHYTWNTFPRPPFDAAVTYLHARAKPGDRIIHANKISVLPMIYYDEQGYPAGDRLPEQYIDDPIGSGTDTLARPTQEVIGWLADPDLPTATQGASRLWYVIFARQLTEGNTPKDLQWLDRHFTRVGQTAFNDLLIYQYTAP
jgi:uncharacterized membrane protein